MTSIQCCRQKSEVHFTKVSILSAECIDTLHRDHGPFRPPYTHTHTHTHTRSLGSLTTLHTKTRTTKPNQTSSSSPSPHRRPTCTFIFSQPSDRGTVCRGRHPLATSVSLQPAKPLGIHPFSKVGFTLLLLFCPCMHTMWYIYSSISYRGLHKQKKKQTGCSHACL